MTEGTQERTWTEAPASVNLKCVYEGYDVMITLRGESGADVLPKLASAITWLSEHGAGGLVTLSGGNGSEPQRNICPIHQVPMKRREKAGDTWYSHKAIDPETGGEYWCRGEAA